MEADLTMPTITQSAAFLNWTRLLSYKENITRHHIKIHDDDDDDITSLVVVCVGLGIMIVMLVLHKCSRDDRPAKCCNFRREDEDMIHVVNAEDPVTSVVGMAAVFSKMKRKDTPPPPYEDPPSYHVAVQIEIEMYDRDLRVAGSS
jgi:hypothetical protein